MSSMRLLSKVIESDSNKPTGSHCIVEWQEKGNPRSIVEAKRVIERVAIGEPCTVKLFEKSKAVIYEGKLVACGMTVFL